MASVRFKNAIATQLAKLTGNDASVILKAIDRPKLKGHGTFAVPLPRLFPSTAVRAVPKKATKEAKRANDHGTSLQDKKTGFLATVGCDFDTTGIIRSVTPAGQFLNFSVDERLYTRETIQDVIRAEATKEEILKTNNNNTNTYPHSLGYGMDPTVGKGQVVAIDYSSPNIAKPFHGGHLRGTILGNFTTRLLRGFGYKVIGINYLGDWGKQYGLLAVGFERYGSEEKLLEDPIKHLFDVYVRVNQDAKENEAVHDEARAYFKKMEDGDEAALKIWSRFRDLSIVKYKDIYARLNIAFDVYSGESQVTDGMERALKMLHEKKLLTESDGALIVDLTAYKLGVCVVQKKDGTTLYITRDIGAALERYEKYGFEHMYYIVASQQDLHLKQLFKILELLGFEWAKKVTHLNFGMVGGMSTRKGTVVFLEDILEETRDSMHEVMKKNEHKYAQIEDPLQVADNIGISAIMIQDASARRVKNYDFDWSRMFSFEGDTGPYLQYAHARLCSIERKTEMEVNPNADLSHLGDSRAAGDLITMIARYPQIVRDTSRSFEPVNIVGYAMKLSHNVSQALESMYVMGAAKEVAEARLFMYWSARVTLGNAMRLLNLKPQDRM
ncbi:Arginyl-tRNA synthetase [Podila epicladia]|nr:Arginyl-tRNA synthetase [Podila epicladia]